MKTRIVYRALWFDSHKAWENMDLRSRNFKTLEEAIAFGEKESYDKTCHVEKVRQHYNYAPLGKVWRDEEYGWENDEDENAVTLVYPSE